SKVGADDLVLLLLDGGHDVAHLARSRSLQRGEQCAGTGQAQLALALAVGEAFVLDALEPTALAEEVATTAEAEWVSPGGSIERLGHGGAPVDDQLLLVLVGDGQ